MPDEALPLVVMKLLLVTVTVPPLPPVPPKPPTSTWTVTLGFSAVSQLPTFGALGISKVHEVASCSETVFALPPLPPPPPIDCANMPFEAPPNVTIPPVCVTVTLPATLPSPPLPPTEAPTCTFVSSSPNGLTDPLKANPSLPPPPPIDCANMPSEPLPVSTCTGSKAR